MRLFQNGWPIWIQDGKIDRPEEQVAQYMRAIFAHIESSGDVPVQANMEIKILIRKA